MANTQHNRLPRWRQIAFVVALSPLLILAAILALALFVIEGLGLRLLIWALWCPRGRDVLFVYSDSPIWHDEIESRILPELGDRAIVLNWSERKRWRWSVARWAFRHFGGDREFNPLAVVFRPFGRTRVFRFWQPFQDFKHGRPEPLDDMKAKFFQVIGAHPGERPA